MAPMFCWGIEHRRRELLAERHVVERFLTHLSKAETVEVSCPAVLPIVFISASAFQLCLRIQTTRALVQCSSRRSNRGAKCEQTGNSRPGVGAGCDQRHSQESADSIEVLALSATGATVL